LNTLIITSYLFLNPFIYFWETIFGSTFSKGGKGGKGGKG